MGFKTSHPLLFQREWKRLKWVVWNQREFTFGQANVSSPEREGVKLCWELVVPEGGKEYQGDEVSSGRLAQVCVPGRKTAHGALSSSGQGSRGLPSDSLGYPPMPFPLPPSSEKLHVSQSGEISACTAEKMSGEALGSFGDWSKPQNSAEPNFPWPALGECKTAKAPLALCSLVQRAASPGTGRKADVSPPSVDFSLGEFLHYLHESQN